MRYFKLLNPLTLPRTLSPGMGNTHKRPKAGDVVAISELACAKDSRFVRGRIRAKDMVEIDKATYDTAVAIALEAAKAAAPTVEPAKPAQIVTGAPVAPAPTVTTEQPAAPAKAK
jgi:hypothetical protein